MRGANKFWQPKTCRLAACVPTLGRALRRATRARGLLVGGGRRPRAATRRGGAPTRTAHTLYPIAQTGPRRSGRPCDRSVRRAMLGVCRRAPAARSVRVDPTGAALARHPAPLAATGAPAWPLVDAGGRRRERRGGPRPIFFFLRAATARHGCPRVRRRTGGSLSFSFFPCSTRWSSDVVSSPPPRCRRGARHGRATPASSAYRRRVGGTIQPPTPVPLLAPPPPRLRPRV